MGERCQVCRLDGWHGVAFGEAVEKAVKPHSAKVLPHALAAPERATLVTPARAGLRWRRAG